jgi:O-antigen/teichoic acid export membrane protein
VSVKRNTGYNLAGAVIPVALSFLTVPLYLHLVGAERYGVLAIAWLLLGYFGIFDMGMGRATSFRIASLKDGSAADRADVFRTAIGINLGIGVVGGLVLWGAGYWFFGSIFKVSAALRSETLAGLPWLAASVPVATLTGVLTGALQGREQFLQTNTVSVVSTILFQLFPLGVAWMIGPHLGGLLGAAVLARIVGILILWVMCHRALTKGQSPRWRQDQARGLLAFGGWVAVNGSIGPLLIMADRFMIGAILSARAVAVYTIPFQLAQRSTMIPNALNNALFPRLTASSPAERLVILDKAISAVAALLTAPVFVGMFIMKPFLILWVGPEIGNDAARIGVIVMIAFWANSFAAVYFTYFQARGTPSTITKILLAQVVPYLALLWFVLRDYGLEGAAWLFLVRAFLTFGGIIAVERPTRRTGWMVLVCAMGLAIGFILSDGITLGDSARIALSLGLAALLAGLSLAILRQDFPSFFRKLPLLGR